MPMKRLWVHVCSALVAVTGAGVLSSACAHNDSSMFVYDVLAGTASSTGCTFTPDPTQQFLPSGVLDTALASEYVATFLVANQMVAQGDPTVPKTETSFITIQRADIRITDTNNVEVARFSTKTAATIPPATGTTPGFVPTEITLIDPATVKTQAPGPGGVNRLETTVQFFGKTTGGQSVESNEFSFPVDLCTSSSEPGKQCLVVFSAAANDPVRTPQPNCFLGGTATGTSVATPCRIGQDAFVDCSLCLDNPVCNPTTAPILDAGPG
jgi:hypothetical protein